MAWHDRFWAKVDRNGPDGCWLWTAGRSGGYGRFRLDGKTLHAHRLSYELHHGPIPKGSSSHDTCVCHRCDNPLCVNPDHLFLGTQADNVRDRDEKGRCRSRGPRGEASGRAKLTAERAAEIRALAGTASQEVIAARFGISRSNVSLIVLNKTWSD